MGTSTGLWAGECTTVSSPSWPLQLVGITQLSRLNSFRGTSGTVNPAPLASPVSKQGQREGLQHTQQQQHDGVPRWGPTSSMAAGAGKTPEKCWQMLPMLSPHPAPLLPQSLPCSLCRASTPLPSYPGHPDCSCAEPPPCSPLTPDTPLLPT